MSSFFSNSTSGEPPRKKFQSEWKHFDRGTTGNNKGSLHFDGLGDEVGSDDEQDGPVVTQPGGGRVGLSLLQSMQQTLTTDSTPDKVFVQPEKLCVVEDYVPLSVGGFLQTSAETPACSMENIRVGDVMCLRFPEVTAPPAVPVKVAVNGRANSDADVPTPSGLCFVKEDELTTEEKMYGKRLTCDMLRELFEVGRVDRSTDSLEALFLDGTRQKLKVWAVRPAGFVESMLYHRWKKDEGSRPVRTVCASPQPVVGADDDAHKVGAERGGGLRGQTEPTAVNAGVWWVTPQLVVRIVEESAIDLLGKKFVVSSVSRKDKKIRLAPWSSATSLVTSTNGTTQGSSIDVVGCEALETVVPRVGECGMIVSGRMRGELVEVTSRLRADDGELHAVKVRSTLTGEEATVEPNEVCLIATAHCQQESKT
ncbi:hypothetical protein ERJ75_001524400 [Trypanosoma vivax]|nr:Trypanosoma vivax [Trypanosoma vivax]KAH8606349.1 hypothetical protein ERJ75_001524400 [Trypanosoma vivax]